MKQHKSNDTIRIIKNITLFLIVLTVAGSFVLYTVFSYNPAHHLYTYLQNDANASVFVVLMALLPLAGLPISVFLVLIGMMFGIPAGIGITAIVMFFHVLATYYLVHSFVRPLLLGFLNRFELKIPRLPRERRKRIGFAFMILPGIPYSLKNYLLALAEMPFRPYVIISWSVQFIMSIPFIVLGRGVVELDPIILILAAVLIVTGLTIQYRLRKRYKKFGVDLEK